MDQDNQKTSGMNQAESSDFDEGLFDGLWDVMTDNSAVKSTGEDSSPLSSLGGLDWGELENDVDIWSGLESAVSTKKEETSDKDVSTATANKAHDLAKNLFSDDEDVVVSHRSKPVESTDGKKSDAEITVRVRASSILNEVEKAVALEKDALDAVTITSMASVAEIESSILDKLDSDLNQSNETTEDSEKSEEKSNDSEKSEEKSDDAEKSEEKSDDSEKSDEKSDDSEKSEEKSDDAEKSDEKSDDAEKSDEKSDDAEKSDDKSDDAEKSESEIMDSDDSGEMDRVRSLLAENDQTSDDEEEADDEDSGVVLSERARMGQFYPEGEVVTADHEVGHDTYYDDADCEPDVAEAPSPKKHRGLILVCAILTSILVGLALISLYTYMTKPVDIIYAQDVVFMDDAGAYQHIAISTDGQFVAMCSDGRGIVKANGQKVSEFWPTYEGCRDLRIADDGKLVWFVDRASHLYELNLEIDHSITATNRGELVGKSMDGFDVVGHKVTYIALADDGMTRVVRTLDLMTKTMSDIALPADALVCKGVYAKGYTYLSQGAVHTVRNGIDEIVSLDSGKLGCAQAPSQMACVSDRAGNWAVLCKDSIHQNKGKTDQTYQPLTDDPAIRSGVKSYQLLRHADGTDFITTDYMYSLDKTGNMKHVQFSTKLGDSFAAARESDKILVANGLSVMSANGEGIVTTPFTNMPQAQVLAANFVGDGSRVTVFSLTGNGTQISLWSLSEAALLRTQTIPGLIESVNVSDKGRFGFVIAQNNGKSVLHWMEWNTVNAIATLPLTHSIENATWSDDEKHVLIRYQDKSWELYAREDNGMRLVRSYPANVYLSFSHNDLMWRVENGRLMNEQIETGKLSVIYDVLDEILEDIGATGIAAHPHSDSVILWGSKGILTLNIAGTQKRALKVLTDSPVTWCVPDRQGKYVATSAGLFEIDNATLHPYSTQLAGPVSWLGSGNYLMSSDGKTMLDARETDHVKPVSIGLKNIGISLIGANSGFHPSRDLVTIVRDGAVSVEKMSNSASASMIAVFAGSQNDKWCWANTNGQRQGKGGLCAPIVQGNNNVVTATNQDVTKQLASQWPAAKQQPSFTPYDLKFVDDVEISIQTVPADAMLVFQGEAGVPQGIAHEDGVVQAPLSTKIKRDSREFSVYIVADGYEGRTVSFKPETGKIALRVPLQPETTSSVGAVWTDTDGTEVTFSEDTNIEFSALVLSDLDAMKRCVKKTDGMFSLALNEDGTFVVPEDTDEKQANCLAPFIKKLQDARQNGALPELSDMVNLNAVVVIL